MSDNTSLNTGIGGDTIRDIDRGTAKTQVVQLDAGGASAESLVSSTNPIPAKISDGTNVLTLGTTTSDGDAGTDIHLPAECYNIAYNGSTWDRVRMYSQGAQWVAPPPSPTATTGSITTAATTVGPVTMGAYDGVQVTVSGTYAGVNFGFWASNDNTNYYPVMGTRTDSGTVESTTGVLTANQTRSWEIDTGGAAYFKVISTAWTSGSAAINILLDAFVGESNVGAITHGIYNTTLPTATAGQPIPLLTDVNGRAIIAGGAASGATIAGAPVLMGGTFTTTLPTVTTGQAVNIQTTARGEQLVAISSGATAVGVKAASTAAVAADPALVVAVSPNNVLKIGDGTTAAVVTAASTAAAAASAALTVTLSPNSPAPATTSANQAVTNINVNASGALAAVKASAGNLFGFSLVNNVATICYASFWNVATGSVTLGTTAPTCVFLIPASGTLTVPPSTMALLNSATAISFACVTAYNGSTTNSVTGSIFYK